MKEEQTPQDQGQAEPTPEAEAGGDGRDWQKLHGEAQTRAEGWKKRVEELEGAEAKAKEAAELKDLEAKNDYTAILAKKDATIEAIQSKHAADILQRDLSSALIAQGATNPVFVRGAVAEFQGGADDIPAFVEKLKGEEHNAVFFGNAIPAGQKPPVHGQPGSRSTSKSLEDRLTDTDPEVRKGAMNEGLKKMMGMP